MASELKRKTTLSLGVSVGSAVATAAMQAAILVCLARLLTPADYGQVAAVLIIAQPIQQILLTGLERSMLLDDHLTSGESSACLALGAMLGVISAILVAVYGLAAGFALNRPSTMFVAFGLVPQLVIGATGCAPRAMLRRQMRFAKLAQSELTAQALGLGLCSIAVAWAGGGPYSLVAGLCIQASIQLGLNLPASGIRLYGPLQLSLIKRIIRRGTNVSVTGFLEMIQTQLPVMSLTAAGALGSVGLFARTLSLMQLPLQMVTTGATKVLYTTFVAVRAESAKLERGVRSLVELTSGMVVPICAGVIFARHDVIAVVLGPRWTDANPLVPLVAVGAACSVLSHVLALVGEATLQLTARFWIQLGVTATTGAILFVLRNRGAEGAAVGFMAGSGLFLATQMALCASVLKLRPIKLLHWLAPSFAAAILVAIYIEATLVFGESWPAALRLVVEITGSSIALGLFYLWAVPGPIGRIVALSGIESAKLSWFARVNRAAVSSGG